MADQTIGPDHDRSPYSKTEFAVVALAASAGGLEALSRILAGLPADFPAAVVVVQHRTLRKPLMLAEILGRRTALFVKTAEAGEALRPATVFVASPGLHLLVCPDGTLALSGSAKVCFVRPSADRLFESLAASLRERAIAVVLTGHNVDGSDGVRAIKRMGGVVISQDVGTAEAPGMPRAAIATGSVDMIVPLNEIAARLVGLVMSNNAGEDRGSWRASAPAYLKS